MMLKMKIGSLRRALHFFVVRAPTRSSSAACRLPNRASSVPRPPPATIHIHLLHQYIYLTADNPYHPSAPLRLSSPPPRCRRARASRCVVRRRQRRAQPSPRPLSSAKAAMARHDPILPGPSRRRTRERHHESDRAREETIRATWSSDGTARDSRDSQTMALLRQCPRCRRCHRSSLVLLDRCRV